MKQNTKQILKRIAVVEDEALMREELLDILKEINKDNNHLFFNTVLKWYGFITINSCLFLIIINNKISEILLKDEFYAARVYVPLLLFDKTNTELVSRLVTVTELRL